MKKLITRITLKALQAKEILRSTRGENFVDSGIKILIAVSSARFCWAVCMRCSATPFSLLSPKRLRICSTSPADGGSTWRSM